MEKRSSLIHNGEANELVWLLEHPNIYTAGSSAKDNEFLGTKKISQYSKHLEVGSIPITDPVNG